LKSFASHTPGFGLASSPVETIRSCDELPSITRLEERAVTDRIEMILG
jgi:hypothetical protein